ncbi:DUF493 family protein [Urechidicola croceus]|uniref:DUF493 domain-containing protein n=1 Tax=Urechidicola croceus TaxID=1850246 RepID=A0A1D8P4R3_9FLAO|nr:DUF493 family protein [Urechidicola croceus]AOW19555.1 hypothetical protein LPB138_02170 [Urechidicola croceus]
MQNRDEFYKKLKERLEDTTTFPTKYLYKFIVPANKDKTKEIENIFNYAGAVINTKDSRTGKYTSVSVLVDMPNSDEIISKYLEAEKIEGIISL